MKKAIVLGIFSVIMSTLHGAAGSSSIIEQERLEKQGLSVFIACVYRERIHSAWNKAARIHVDRDFRRGAMDRFIQRAVVQDYSQFLNLPPFLVATQNPESIKFHDIHRAASILQAQVVQDMKIEPYDKLADSNAKSKYWQAFHFQVRSILIKRTKGSKFELKETDEQTMKVHTQSDVQYLQKEREGILFNDPILAAATIVSARMLQYNFDKDERWFLQQPEIQNFKKNPLMNGSTIAPVIVGIERILGMPGRSDCSEELSDFEVLQLVTAPKLIPFLM